MRYLAFFPLLFSSITLCAQTRGVNPVNAGPEVAFSGTIHAVVVGISDYQDPGIKDLRFAHRDAEEFVKYLQSPAGGNVPDENITLLLNEDATSGNVSMALDALLDVAQENDRVIIYFSGHGDVERKTVSQPGFLLCWNSPPRVYTGGGTYSLFFLQNVVSTLATQNNAKVIVITDACHAGTLAGANNGGVALTGASLLNRYANEIKILSCQPEQLSMENEKWGGGRGIFSYYLLNGLYGLADEQEDGFVTLSELDRYLEDNVSTDADANGQQPMIVGGSKTDRIGVVDADMLAFVKSQIHGGGQAGGAVASRGMHETVPDSSVQEKYRLFQVALENKRFFAPENSCAETLYQQLIHEPSMAPQKNLMTRQYVAALQDEAQTAINDYLATDPEELRQRWTHTDKYNPFPRYLQRAAELLGADHYLSPMLNARGAYFQGVIKRLQGEQNKDKSLFQQAIQLQQDALQLEPDAAFAYNELGLLYRRLEDYIQSIDYFRSAIDLAPQWALAITNLSASHIELGNVEEGIRYGNLAIAADSNFALPYYNLGYLYHSRKEYEKAETYYEAALKVDSTYAKVFFNLGLIQYHQQKFADAEKVWLQYANLDPADPDGFVNLIFAAVEQGENEKALEYLEKALIAGYNDFEEIKTDGQLAPVRQLPAYQDLVEKYFPK